MATALGGHLQASFGQHLPVGQSGRQSGPKQTKGVVFSWSFGGCLPAELQRLHKVLHCFLNDLLGVYEQDI